MNRHRLKIHSIGILLLSIIVTIVMHDTMDGYLKIGFMGQFILIVFHTASLWIANSLIFHTLYARYPSFADTRKRILIGSAYMVLATTVIIGILYSSVCFSLVGWDWIILFTDLKYSYLFTALAMIVHESVYFFQRWQESLFAAEKLQKETTQAQLESLRTQVNPHFLFNSLNTLIALIPQDAAKSVDFVRKLSEVYRYLLKAQCNELTSVREEMKMANAYLFLLETRFQHALQVRVKLDQSVYPLYIPPVSIQLLIENCIKHNIVSKDKVLTIEIFSEHNTLVVKNNLQKKEISEESTGLGLMNIQKRYSLLSDKKIEIEEDGRNFSVKLPLLEINQHLV